MYVTISKEVSVDNAPILVCICLSLVVSRSGRLLGPSLKTWMECSHDRDHGGKRTCPPSSQSSYLGRGGGQCVGGHSEAVPMVILEGKPWGLKMMSGTIPDSVNGMLSDGHLWLCGCVVGSVVWADTGAVWNIPTDSLLTCSTGKFVSNYRVSLRNIINIVNHSVASVCSTYTYSQLDECFL